MAPWQETAGFLCWVVKDFSWVLLIPEMAWFALFGALIFECWDLANAWQASDAYERGSRFVILLWILGNGTWMTSEFLYETHSRNISFPWFHGALLGPKTWADTIFIVCAATFWILALIIGVGTQTLGRQPGHPTSLFRRLNADLWCIFWILKDSFWLMRLAWPAIVSSLLVLYCLIALKGGNPISGCPLLTIAEIYWLCANTIWLIGELLLDDILGTRVFAGIFLSLAFYYGLKNLRELDDEESVLELFGGSTFGLAVPDPTFPPLASVSLKQTADAPTYVCADVRADVRFARPEAILSKPVSKK